MPRAPVPWVSLTKIENLPFLSTRPTVLGCSCANNRPPSFVPTIPSALSGPCQTSFHLAPAAMTPGIAATVTSRSGAGCEKPRSPPAFGCWPASISPGTRSNPGKQQASVNNVLNLINSQNGCQVGGSIHPIYTEKSPSAKECLQSKRPPATIVVCN